MNCIRKSSNNIKDMSFMKLCRTYISACSSVENIVNLSLQEHHSDQSSELIALDFAPDIHRFEVSTYTA
jgi:hypothetical protein